MNPRASTRVRRGAAERAQAWWRRLLPALAAAHLVFQVAVWLPVRWRHTETCWDANDYYWAARRVHTGGPLYRPWPEYGPDVLTPGHPYPKDRFPYPPPMAAAMAPFTELPFPVFARCWILIVLAGFWVYAACLGALALGRASWRGTLVAGLAVGACPGAYLALSFGNVDPILWALFGLALATPAAGAALAASSLVKLYGVWPLAVAVRREGIRVLIPAVLVLGAGLALGAAAGGGLRIWVDWVRDFLPVLAQGTFNAGNLSLSFAVLRLARLLGWHYPGGPLPAMARAFLTIVALGGPAAAAWMLRRRPRRLQYAGVGAAAALSGPLCWPYYLALAFAPAAIVWRERTAAVAARTDPAIPVSNDAKMSGPAADSTGVKAPRDPSRG